MNINKKRNILGWLARIIIFSITTFLFLISDKSSDICVVYFSCMPFFTLLVPFFLIRIIFPIEDDQLD